jgi:hypothetical protein
MLSFTSSLWSHLSFNNLKSEVIFFHFLTCGKNEKEGGKITI